MSEFIQPLVDAGMTLAQASRLATELGITGEEDFWLINEDDITSMGLSPIQARRFLAHLNGVSGSSGVPQTIGGSNPSSVQEINDPKKLLEIICGELSIEWKTHAAARLHMLGQNVVTNTDGTPLVEETLLYWQMGSSNTKFWGRKQHPVVSPRSLYVSEEMVEVDPFILAKTNSYVLLHEGYNSDDGVDWSGVPVIRRALLLLAAIHQPLLLTSPWDVAAKLHADHPLSGGWAVLNTRTGHLLQGQMNRLSIPLRHWNPEPAPPQSSICTITPCAAVSNAEMVEALEKLLMSLFNARGIRDLDWDIRPHLPESPASVQYVASQFIEEASMRGLLKQKKFWIGLTTKSPHRRTEIRVVAVMYGFSV